MIEVICLKEDYSGRVWSRLVFPDIPVATGYVATWDSNGGANAIKLSRIGEMEELPSDEAAELIGLYMKLHGDGSFVLKQKSLKKWRRENQ